MTPSRALAVILLIAGCSHAGPARSVPEQVWSNLKQQRSFRFTLTLSRTEVPLVAGSFTGTILLPDTIEVEGAWADQPPTRIKARGDQEYLQTSGADTVWTIQARGEEADYLAQFERVLAHDSFTMLSRDRAFEEYSFRPNLVFLDPFQNKKLSGRFRIRRDRRLPEAIRVTSSDSTVKWEVRFDSFNTAPVIRFPFVRQWQAKIVVAESLPLEPLNPGTFEPFFKEDTSDLRRRFARHGFTVRFTPHADTLIIDLEREVRLPLFNALLQPGRAQVWLSRHYFGQGPIPPGAQLLPALGDSTEMMVIERPVLERPDLARVETAESAGTSLLRLTLTRRGEGKLARHSLLEQSGISWALVVDGGIKAKSRIAKRLPGHLDLVGPENRQLAERLKDILESPPLARGYRVVSQERVAP